MIQCTKCHRPEGEQVGDKMVTFKVGHKICMICKSEQVAQWKKDNPDKVAKHQRTVRANSPIKRICKKCDTPKSISLFKKLCCVCKDCQQKAIDEVNQRKLKAQKVVSVRKFKESIKPPKEIKVMPTRNTNQVRIEVKQTSEINYGRSIKTVHKDFYTKHLPEIKRRIAERYAV